MVSPVGPEIKPRGLTPPTRLGENCRMSATRNLACRICGKISSTADAVPAESVRGPILELIKEKFPDWDGTGCICRNDLKMLRAEYVQHVLESEKGEAESMIDGMTRRIPDLELMTKNFNDELDRKTSFGDRMADRLADFGGSWTFIIIFFGVLVLWVALNSALIKANAFDPYPFIFLNLILSCVAAIQAPVILMSQNREETKDRLRAEHDFQTNLRAEMEIRYLHDKLDYLLMHQWQRLLEIQQIQMELMEQVTAEKREEPVDPEVKEI
jgi:uncharacterized membrane protein